MCVFVRVRPQFRLVMHYLSEMTEEQTLVMYSGHPMGLFPSLPSSPRAIITNGMVTAQHTQLTLTTYTFLLHFHTHVSRCNHAFHLTLFSASSTCVLI